MEESYKMYPIRCKTCNEQIAAFSSDYEELLNKGFSIAAALDQLGIFPYCSRKAMMDPVIVHFDMEDRNVIQGFQSIDDLPIPEAKLFNSENSNFNLCEKSNEKAFGYKKKMEREKETVNFKVGGKDKVDEDNIFIFNEDFENYNGQVIEEKEIVQLKFEEPEKNGVPVYNIDTVHEKNYENVGTNKRSEIITGRTYLSR